MKAKSEFALGCATTLPENLAKVAFMIYIIAKKPMIYIIN